MAEKKTKVYPVRLDLRVYARLKDLAAKEDMNTAQLIRRAIRRQFEAIDREARANAGA